PLAITEHRFWGAAFVCLTTHRRRERRIRTKANYALLREAELYRNARDKGTGQQPACRQHLWFKPYSEARIAKSQGQCGWQGLLLWFAGSHSTRKLLTPSSAASSAAPPNCTTATPSTPHSIMA